MDSLDDKVEPFPNGWGEGYSWVVLLPSGGTSGAFGDRDEAIEYAREVWPMLLVTE